VKLHHLHLQGIGPFRGEVDLDLVALGASGMFLLEGPTGSGKSTILDAIVYALYGKVAGDDTADARIRSQFADPRSASVVDLLFETGSGIFRVRREPAYERAKKRGTGTTPQHAKALLWRVGSPDLVPAVVAEMQGGAAGNGGGVGAGRSGTDGDSATGGMTGSSGGETLEPLATRLDEVGREITRAVGLSREQFTQTVLLPQNEFARFLRAGSGERQQVLQRVFGTEIYQQVEKQLEVMRRQASKDVETATSALGRAATRFVEATGVETDGTDTDDTDGTGGGTGATSLVDHAQALHLDALRATAREHLAIAREVAGGDAALAALAHDAQKTAQQQVESAETVRRRVTRRRELDALAERLERERPQVEDARRRRTLDEAARPVLAALDRRDAARQQTESREQDLQDEVKASRGDHAPLVEIIGSEDSDDHTGEDAADVVHALGTAAEEATGQAGALQSLVDLEAGLDERTAALEERTTGIDKDARALEELAARNAERPAGRQELVTAREKARAVADGLADARLAAQKASEHLKAARAARSARESVEKARAQAEKDHEAATAAAQEESALRQAHLAGIAAELALDLADGQPCPVCGATEHPQLAASAPGHVDAEQVEQAETRRREADERRAASAQALTAAQTTLAEHEEHADGLDVAQAGEAKDEATAAVTVAKGAKEQVAGLDRKLEAFDQETTALQRSVAEKESDLRAARTARDEQTAQLTRDRSRVADARGQAGSVAERMAAHQARARAALRLQDALRARDQAREQETLRVQEVRAAREDALARIPETDREAFGSDVQIREAVLTDQARAASAELLERRTGEESRLAAGMAEDGIADADASQEALDAAEAACTTARESLDAATGRARSAGDRAARSSDRAERAQQARVALQAAITRAEATQRRSGVVVRVADLATGRSSDGDRIPLSTFVLMRRFEDVLAAANTRLSQFSNANLELLRDPGARGARKTGLDLLVLDRRTDQMRVPETLSGGETFFVSLALALGLADIVTAEAGGVRMETLFIDEGFGSLDPETLETVVAEITHLVDAGRTIGIVSHVGEMKNQIAEQVHVRRRADGSSGVTVTA
jgi:exonuclease SbcC